jgi:hypothetical protein
VQGVKTREPAFDQDGDPIPGFTITLTALSERAQPEDRDMMARHRQRFQRIVLADPARKP